jgi:hypothetical protein
MNRTAEFLAALKCHPVDSAHEPPAQRPADDLSRRSRDIKAQLDKGRATLDDLTALISRTDDLDESNPHIEELVLSLRRNFFAINQDIEEVESMRSPPPHLATVAKSLRRNLKGITSDFNLAMDRRAAKIEATIARRRSQNVAVRHTTSQYSTLYGGDDRDQRQGQDQLLMEHSVNRLEAVRNVESSVHEIAQLFSQLSEVIVRDDYQIQRIDEQTEEALVHLDEGEKSLKALWDRVKGNRSLLLKLFLVLIVAALIFILII